MDCEGSPLREEPLYQQIAESIRRRLQTGELKPGQQLPTVRDLAREWGCAPGTAQRAYNLLNQQGIIQGRSGHGTHVADAPTLPEASSNRQAVLASEVDRFLQQMRSAGFSPDQIERSLWFGLDRLQAGPPAAGAEAGFQLRFVGSHDPLISHLAQRLAEGAPAYRMQVRYAGSLGGLMALAQGEADLAGCHLWDAESDTYNVPYVRRLLPGHPVALIMLAQRTLGLIVAPGNPHHIQSLQDLTAPGLRFINRQAGAGTRVWLDAQLQRLGILHEAIEGYGTIAYTHADVCAAIAEEQAEVGLGIQSAAANYALHFIPLTVEPYELAVDSPRWDASPVQSVLHILQTAAFKRLVHSTDGYDASMTGTVRWVGPTS
ncbi:MAG: substrate-binding domain-containing protein [Anaerolineales bacterium]